MTKIENPKVFLLAGKAHFCLYSEKSTTRRDYHILAEERKSRFRVVHQQEVIGYITGEAFYFSGAVRESLLSHSTLLAAKAFEWYWTKLINNQPIDKRFYACHLGRCGKCSRVLTDEASIGRGIGPDCWKKLQ